MFHHGTTAPMPARTTEWYRYAQETGLISPHHERVYVPEWELQLRSPDGGVRGSDAGSSGTPGVGGVVERLRVGKRYHGTTEDHENFTPDRHVGERRVRRALRVVNDDG